MQKILHVSDNPEHFSSIGSALAQIPANNTTPVIIEIAPGIYHEKLTINKPYITLRGMGESSAHTVISYDDYALDLMEDGSKRGTFRTYTLKVQGSYITLKNITIENNAAKLGQAVSLHLEGDHILVQNCRLLGNQDTVYTGIANNRSAFYDCYIEGTTDFIFGPGRAWFENCEIRSKANSYITAASSPAGQEYGYVFNKCKLTAEPGVDKVYLGRPWRPYAATLFMNCEMGSHIRPEGWHNWGKQSNEQTARYSEYNNHGSGAATKARVAWSRQLTKKEAAKVTIKNVFGEEAW